MSAQGPSGPWQLRLIDGWRLCAQKTCVSVPHRGQRLVAFLALHASVPRTVVAGGLWPDSTEARARSNLRTTAVRLRRSVPGLLATTMEPLSLSEDVAVDLHGLRALLAAAPDTSDPAGTARLLLQAGVLLPGWYDDWVLLEREHLHLALVVTLEQLAERMLEDADLPGAMQAASACTRLEPLRESSHRLLVRTHLAAGNRVEAWRTYERFRRRSIAEFGLAPNPSFDELVAPLRQERRERSHRLGDRC